MAKKTAAQEPVPALDADRQYTVLARRYRPQRFEDFVGQEAVVQALGSAIAQNRIAHAYLFTGSRGVGKTSMARMFARALNCVRGPTIDPCGECDQCQAIAVGQDVDVLEIDGASNNRIDEARELRQAVAIRPSRSRFKIYIIDEVHMVTPQAFNALLKTLEEPPPHVKFIFATTEVQKIPITILSRCQRFDFGGIAVEKIKERLQFIAKEEKVEVEDEVLDLVARRAGGSMRDSQSLFDQLLAFTGGKVTAENAHRALGTASDDRVRQLASALLTGDAAEALRLVDRGAADGVQLGEWVEQSVEFFRDLMVLSVAPNAPLLSMPNRLREELAAQAAERTTERVVEIMDLLVACRGRMKSSPFPRTLLEMTVVRAARLDRFASLDRLLASGPPQALPAPAARALPPPTAPVPVSEPEREKKTPDVAPPHAALNGEPRGVALTPVETPAGDVTAGNWRTFWAGFLGRLQGSDPFLAKMLQDAERVECSSPNVLVATVAGLFYNSCKSYAEHARTRLEQAARDTAGRAVALKIEAGSAPPANAAPESSQLLRREAQDDPLIRRLEQTLGASIIDPVVRLAPKAAEIPVETAVEAAADDAEELAAVGDPDAMLEEESEP